MSLPAPLANGPNFFCGFPRPGGGVGLIGLEMCNRDVSNVPTGDGMGGSGGSEGGFLEVGVLEVGRPL